MNLIDHIKAAGAMGRALGHFNISNLEGLWGIFRAARALELPVVIGVSEGERDFVGVRQAAAIVKSLRDEFNYPIFLNPDHSYSFDRVKEAIDAGFDAVIFDGSDLSLEENIKITRQCVDYARSQPRPVVVEGEIGYIGKSSQVLDKIPDAVNLDPASLPTPEEAARFVQATGVDLLAPAVGNIHGMLKHGHDPALQIDLIKRISATAGVPLVLHGASGNTDEDVSAAITAGISLVHINTEIRVAWRDAVKKSLQDQPDEVAPYKIMKESVQTVERVVDKKLRLFNALPAS